MLGEPEFDVPSFLWNPIGREMDPDRVGSRLDAFAEAGLDEERMRAWTVIRAAYLGADPRQADLIRSLA